jgi:hypothetical protein
VLAARNWGRPQGNANTSGQSVRATPSRAKLLAHEHRQFYGTARVLFCVRTGETESDLSGAGEPSTRANARGVTPTHRGSMPSACMHMQQAGSVGGAAEAVRGLVAALARAVFGSLHAAWPGPDPPISQAMTPPHLPVTHGCMSLGFNGQH